MRGLAVVSSLLLLSGCASILNGTTQQVAVNTTPSGAKCGYYRNNERIATLDTTPGSALVNRTNNGIWIACVKDGYQPASYKDASGLSGAVFGNILLGGLIGVLVDVASGADNKYDSPVNLTFVPLQPGQAGMADLPPTFNGAFPPVAPPMPAAPSQGAPTS